MPEARLLCVGDMHLGRRPSRLPLGAPEGLGPREAWREVVEAARAREVDAVLLAGDVVESANGALEAYGELLAGARRLREAGIDLVAVAGNHDVRELPRLADELPEVHLLGRGGRWSTHVVRRDGEPVARVLGWSFPDARYEASPLDALTSAQRAGRYDDGADDDLRTVGLLHGELDASASRYAPVARRALEQLGLSAWFLGHVHAPTLGTGGRPLGYLGSLVALDPGEPGVHGPWLAESRAGAWHLEQLPLSPVRYETLDVDVSACSDRVAVEVALHRAVQALHVALGLGGGRGARVVAVRPRLVGETELAPAELAAALAAAQALELEPLDDVLYGFDKGSDATTPRVDLERLARGNDPVALLARRVRALRAGDADARELVAAARERFAEVSASRWLAPLPAAQASDDEVRALLERAAWRALRKLLEQRGRALATAEVTA